MEKTKTEQLRRLLAEATPGKWIYDDGQIIFNAPYNCDEDVHWCWNSFPAQYWQGFDDDRNKHDSDKDGNLICFLRNNAAMLLEIVEALDNLTYGDAYDRAHVKYEKLNPLLVARKKWNGGE